MKSALVAAAALTLVVAGHDAGAQGFPIVVNECATGSGGWIELVNRSSTPADLAGDPERCWMVDDAAAGGAPKRITDQNVSHPAESTTCAQHNRGAGCGIIGPGERVWVRYAFINAATPDSCRLIATPRAGATCGSPLADTGTGGPTSPGPVGQCFGRQPDGGGWNAAPLECTPGATNGACTIGAACDDGNPCTSGESFTAGCVCRGGSPQSGIACGPSRSCQAGRCLATSADAPATIVRPGAGGYLLMGTVVTPEVVLEGEVLITGDEIRCVAASCASDPAAATVTVIQTNGLIFPGLIDTHNHIQFNVFDESDWSPEPTDTFTNHDQWPNRPRYKAMVDAKQYLNGEGGSAVKVGCELVKYGELKAVISGTTSVLGAAIPTNMQCYGSLARTIDQRPNGLPADRVQAATLFPRNTVEASKICQNFTARTTDAFLIHIAEGVDPISRGEFQKLFDITSPRGCLFSPNTTIVHGASLQEPHLDTMAGHGMGLVWSPASNVFLYGHGTDFRQTSNIPAAIERGITVALAPDWSIGGSQNLLDELRYADRVDNNTWGDALTPRRLVDMVTRNPARLLGLAGTLGELTPGARADVMVVGGDRSRPHEALLAATPTGVRLVMVGGRVLYGDQGLQPASATAAACEPLDLCGTSKFLCVSQPAATAASKLGQSYQIIRSTLVTELKKYDNLNRSAWDFSPIAELYRCPSAPP